MKIIVVVFLILNSFMLGAQEVYKSSITQTWPSIFKSDYQEINRTISFEENAIIIGTEVSRGKEFEILYIREVVVDDGNLVYKCMTANNNSVTIAIPAKGMVHKIDLYRKSPKSGEEIQMRFHVF